MTNLVSNVLSPHELEDSGNQENLRESKKEQKYFFLD